MRSLYAQFIGRFARSAPPAEIKYDLAFPFTSSDSPRVRYGTVARFLDLKAEEQASSRFLLKIRKPCGPDFVIDLGAPAVLVVNPDRLSIHAVAPDFTAQEYLEATEAGLLDKHGCLIGGRMSRFTGGVQSLWPRDTLKSLSVTIEAN